MEGKTAFSLAKHTQKKETQSSELSCVHLLMSNGLNTHLALRG